MNQEQAIWKDQRRKKKFEAQKLEKEIKELRHALRMDLNPHAPITELNGSLIYDQAIRLKDAIILYDAVTKEIANINESLGTE